MLKDPDAKLPFAVDWSAWLAGEDDTPVSVTWFVPEGITEESSSFANGKATIWLSGGTLGHTYELICHIVTTGGREDDRTLPITITER